MKTAPAKLRSAAGLLVIAALLPLAPVLAQDSAPAEDPPAAEAPAEPKAKAEPAPPVEKATPPAEAAAPVAIPAPQAPAAEREAPVRTPPRVRVPAPAPAPSLPSGELPPVAAPVGGTAGIPAPSPEAGLTTEVLPEPEPVTIEPLQPQQASEGGMSPLPFLVAGALLVAGLAFFLLRRRRRVQSEVYERVEERTESLTEALAPEPAAAPAPVAAPAAPVIPTMVGPVVAAPAAAPVAAAAAEEGRPALDLAIHALRAGVTDGEAKVEFELIVENRGSATAHDLRVSTFLFAAGPGQESEIERLLIERAEHGEAELPRTDLEAGMGKRIEASVELSTANVEGGSVLPVVVAEARYRLPGGGEERKSASYAVGLPDGEELAHFATDNPSGLHEGVEARPLG